MYAATVLIRRTEKQFWIMSPRKLSALVKAHVEVNGGEGDKPAAPKQGFIDQVM